MEKCIVDTLTLSLEERHARDSPPLAQEEVFQTPEADWPCTLRDLLLKSGQNGSCGKTSSELCQLTADGISGRSSGRWTTSGIVSHGECLTLNTSEHPSAVVASSLSGILETGDVPQQCYLSAKACEGLLRRLKSTRGMFSPHTVSVLKTVISHAASQQNCDTTAR